MILKHDLLKEGFESLSGCLLDYITHLLSLINADVYSTCEKVWINGGFNAEEGEKSLKRRKSLNKEATCYKNPNTPKCIDLIFNTKTYFTGLSDCHTLVLSVFKTTISKTGPKEMMYRDYKNFDHDIFSQEHCTSLSSETVLDYTSFE